MNNRFQSLEFRSQSLLLAAQLREGAIHVGARKACVVVGELEVLRRLVGPKDRIEPMKWTNELFHQFRKYQQISQKLENFLQINIFSVFS